jgi:hypothetical protein
MKQDTIFQFVCFDTSLPLNQFIPLWEIFAEKFVTNKASAITLYGQESTRNKLGYISKNEWPSDEFQFVFQNGKVSDKFPAGQVRVIQAGGYSPVQIEQTKKTPKGEIKILAFVKDQRTEIDFYRGLRPYQYLNIYEAYYENSMYNYVLEFFVKPADAVNIIDQLKKESLHIDIGMYKECVLEHV